MTQVDTLQPRASRAEPGPSPVRRLQHLLHAHPAVSPFIILVLTAVIFTAVNPAFGRSTTVSLLLQQTAIVAALAIGQTLIVLTAGIDLSVGAVAILAAMVSATLAVDHGLSGGVALLIAVVCAVGASGINGLLVTRLTLPPFIVTLGTLGVFTAIALLVSGAQSVSARDLPSLMSWTGNRVSLGGIDLTTGVLLVLVAYVVVAFALNQTAWGRHVYAVGGDAEAARLSGIRTNRVILSVYLVAGVTYALAAWVLIGRAGAATPNGIADGNLDSITAVVIGGTSLFGGRGGLVGTLMGALIVQSFTLGLALAGVDAQFRLLAVGLLVIIAVSVDRWIREVKA